MPSRRSPDPFAVQIGERIRQLRKEKSMSLSKLARASDMSRGHLSDLERGKVMMTIGTLGSIACGLELPPFMIMLVPKDDPEVAVIDHAFALAGGDPRKAAARIRTILESGQPDEPKEPAPEE